MRNPFSRFKKKTQQGLIWYARFWNAKVKEYTDARSTGVVVSGKKGRQKEAWDQSMPILPTIGFEYPEDIGRNAVDKPFLEYVADFWKQGSEYIKDCADIGKKPLSSQYIRGNADDTRPHLKPYKPFQKITFGQLKARDIRDGLIDLTLNTGGPKSILDCLFFSMHHRQGERCNGK
jgi:hypothetical protein